LPYTKSAATDTEDASRNWWRVDEIQARIFDQTSNRLGKEISICWRAPIWEITNSEARKFFSPICRGPKSGVLGLGFQTRIDVECHGIARNWSAGEGRCHAQERALEMSAY
jgi:hypothetical protein